MAKTWCLFTPIKARFLHPIDLRCSVSRPLDAIHRAIEDKTSEAKIDILQTSDHSNSTVSQLTNMDDHATQTDASLYDQDFYAWTQEQAALLRGGRIAAADLPNILEEIETLGRKELSELRSRLRILAAHLLKEIYQPDQASRSWRTTILTQRIAIADHISDNPSLKPKLAEAFARAYKDARELASSETELPLATFPEEPPFGYEDAMSKAWMPPIALKSSDD